MIMDNRRQEMRMIAALLLAVHTAMPWMLFASGSSSERVLAHRREVREAVAAGGLSASERALKDKDPGVRRFALYSVYERNQERGVVAARRMLKDRNASVRALAQELLRDRTVRKTPTAGLPLSQNPVNDHELTHIKSIVGENGRFVLPPKIKSDVVEVWFGRPYRSVKAWVNDSFAGEWHMERDSGREFRVDATRLVKWDSANKVLVMDAQGSIISMKFSVEVIKCEQ